MFENLDELQTVSEFESAALAKLHYKARCYFSAAAGENGSMRINEKSLQNYKIQPRILRDVSMPNLSTSILGLKASFPLGISPVAYHHLAHSDTEIGTSKAAGEEDVVMVVSCASSVCVEDIPKECPKGKKWLQLYIFKNRSITEKLVEAATLCGGYSAVVLTVDSPIGGLWRSKLTQNFFSNEAKPKANLPERINEILDPSLTFNDLLWLKSITNLPIVAKGIMNGKDAVLAIQHGVSAVWVSNHGARQIDGVLPTVDVLEEVATAVREVNPGVEVYFDGGVRSGSDVFRALALGANAVFVGRPAIWGLNVAGKAGVRKVLQILKKELQMTMQLAGAQCLEHITRDMVVKNTCYSCCKL